MVVELNPARSVITLVADKSRLGSKVSNNALVRLAVLRDTVRRFRLIFLYFFIYFNFQGAAFNALCNACRARPIRCVGPSKSRATRLVPQTASDEAANAGLQTIATIRTSVRLVSSWSFSFFGKSGAAQIVGVVQSFTALKGAKRRQKPHL